MAVKELPPHDALSFTTRLFDRVRKTWGYVEVPDSTGKLVKYQVKNDSPGYAAFDPAGAGSYNKFVGGLRGLQDDVERVEVALLGDDGIKEHLDRVDARENARHAAVDARLDALEAAHRPFGSGSG